MNYCKQCGAPLDEKTRSCPACNTPQKANTDPQVLAHPLHFSVWNAALLPDLILITVSLLCFFWLWSLQSDLSSFFYGKEKMVLKLIAILMLADAPLNVWNMFQRKKVCIHLEPDQVRGIWIRSQFMVQTQPFDLSYHEIQDTRVQGFGTGRLALKVQGRWMDLPVDQGRRVKEIIDQQKKSKSTSVSSSCSL